MFVWDGSTTAKDPVRILDGAVKALGNRINSRYCLIIEKR